MVNIIKELTERCGVETLQLYDNPIDKSDISWYLYYILGTYIFDKYNNNNMTYNGDQDTLKIILGWTYMLPYMNVDGILNE
jgi:hypothetical protein